MESEPRPSFTPIPHLTTFRHDACTCRRFAIDEFGDHLHCCTQHAGATTGAHEHILTAVQRLFTKAGYKTDRKHVPHSRGLKRTGVWQTLEKKKEYIHTHSYTQVVVHISMYDGEET